MQMRRWEINSLKLQGPTLSEKFLDSNNLDHAKISLLWEEKHQFTYKIHFTLSVLNADPGKKALNPVQTDMEATLPTGLYDPA